MARFRWTDEFEAQLRRLMNYEKSYAEIGRILGCSEGAARTRASRCGFASPGRSGYLARKRFAGKPKSRDHAAALAAGIRARWTDPSLRERMLASLRSEKTQAKRKATAAVALDRSRGFSVPTEMVEDYRFLRISKLLPAREAAAVLGLLPRSTTASKGA